MSDKISILISALINSNKDDMQKQLDTLAKKIKINLNPKIDLSETSINKFKADIEKLAKKIKVNLQVTVDKKSFIDAEKATENVVKKVSKNSKDNSNIKLQIFDKDKLEAEGRQFFISSTGIVNRVKKQFSSLGDVNVNFLKNSKEQVTGFIAEIKKVDGTIDKLKYDMAKITVGNSTQKGFVFSGANLIDKNAGDNLQKTLNTVQQFELKLSKLRDSFTSLKGVKDTTNLGILNKEYNSIFDTLNKLKTTQTNVTEEQKRNITKQISVLDSS
jgi:hypothetical protein